MTTSPRARIVTTLGGAGFIAQAARYLAVGTSGMALYLGSYAALTLVLSAVAANVAAWLISTVVCNFAHRRVTYAVTASETARTDAVVGFGASLIGLALSSAAVALASSASSVWQLLALMGGTAVGGAARFFVMRWWLMKPTRIDAQVPAYSC